MIMSVARKSTPGVCCGNFQIACAAGESNHTGARGLLLPDNGRCLCYCHKVLAERTILRPWPGRRSCQQEEQELSIADTQGRWSQFERPIWLFLEVRVLFVRDPGNRLLCEESAQKGLETALCCSFSQDLVSASGRKHPDQEQQDAQREQACGHVDEDLAEKTICHYDNKK